MITQRTYSDKETYTLAMKMSEQINPGSVVGLVGDLGVGKTVFAKGFAKGLGIDEAITSPTFTIVCEYEGRLPFYHFDVYRIEDYEELFEIGFEEYLYGGGVCLIEWANKIADDIPTDATYINIEKALDEGEDVRIIKIGEYGEIL